jgi:type II secretory pathway component PulJ
MNAPIKNKVEGSTLVEILVALAIISFCASLAMIIYLNIQKSNLPFFKIKAVEWSEVRMKEALEKRDLSEEVYKEEEFTVKKIISRHPEFNDCFIVRIIVFDGSKKKILDLESTLFKRN